MIKESQDGQVFCIIQVFRRRETLRQLQNLYRKNIILPLSLLLK